VSPASLESHFNSPANYYSSQLAKVYSQKGEEFCWVYQYMDMEQIGPRNEGTIESNQDEDPQAQLVSNNSHEASHRPTVSQALFSDPPPASTMASSQHPKGRDGVLTALSLLVQALNAAKDACGIPPAQIAFGSASVLLTMIRVRLSLLRGDELLADIV
jgi:hypothetical protein